MTVYYNVGGKERGWKRLQRYVKIMLEINRYLKWRIFVMKAIKITLPVITVFLLDSVC